MTSTTPLALIILLHPKTKENRDKVIKLHNSLTPYFRKPSTQCTSKSIFTPATRPKANLGMVPAAEKDSILGLVEIWSSPAALTAVRNSSEYKSYGESVAKAGLYDSSKDMDLTAWIPAAGFVARKNEKETPKAGIVMLAKFVLKDGDLDANRAGMVEVLGNFCNWIEHNEPGTYTYYVLRSKDSPNELLLFERYKNLAALGVHGKTAEFKAMFKGTGRFVQGRKTVLSEWEELDGSFVSNTPGGAGAGGQAKL